MIRARSQVLVSLGLVLALAVHYWLLFPSVATSHEEFDAVHLYLPLADALRQGGLAFFADERSIQAPPFSYLYPLLLGRDLGVIKLANFLLSGMTLLCVFRVAQLSHSSRAGLIAAWLFVLCPLIRPYLSPPITEAPYIFLSAAWLWGLAEWLHSGRRAALAISAIALSLATLTRATMFYGVIVLVLGSAFAAWRSSNDSSRRVALGALIAYSLSLAAPLLFSLKNLLVFGFPFYVTGGGNALYLGLNPLTGGFDPHYVGLEFDVGAIAQLQSHLTLRAEHLLRGVAKMIVAETPLPTLLANLSLKSAAFLFVTNAQPEVLLLRPWRIALVLAAVPGIWAINNRAMRWVLGGMLAYQFAIHVPVLYTHRYSVGAMDLWLIVAAAIGVASFRLRRHWPYIPVLIAALWTGKYCYDRLGPPMPDVFAVGRLLVWDAGSPNALTHQKPVLEMEIPDSYWFRWRINYVIVMDVASSADAKDRCDDLRVSFRPHDSPGFTAPVVRHIATEKERSRYQFGGAPLSLYSHGTLRIEAACRQGAQLSIERLRLYAALGAMDYRERLLGQAPELPVERQVP